MLAFAAEFDHRPNRIGTAKSAWRQGTGEHRMPFPLPVYYYECLCRAVELAEGLNAIEAEERVGSQYAPSTRRNRMAKACNLFAVSEQRSVKVSDLIRYWNPKLRMGTARGAIPRLSVP